jgi:hypothetical protein
MLAEEFSEEALSRSNAMACTVRDAARRLQVSHLLCDPDSQERGRLGVTTDDLREQVWLNRLLAAGAERVLFVCGDDHLDTFPARLRDAGHCAEELSRGHGRNRPLRD